MTSVHPGRRVVALGGAGAMGAVSSRMLAAHPDITELVVTDLDDRRAAAVTTGLGVAATPLSLDLCDPAALHAAVAGADLVVNTTGPYDRFGALALDAAIAAGADYIDICDDPRPTLDMLDRDAAARTAGTTAVIGMGASPGVTNLLARVAADQLDDIDSILTAWPEDPVADLAARPDGSLGAATVHWVAQLSHPGPVLTDGVLRDVAPLQRSSVDYPDVGQGDVWTVGHPEAVTLHHAWPTLRESRNAMVITPVVARELQRCAAAVRAGATVESAATELKHRLTSLDPSPGPCRHPAVLVVVRPRSRSTPGTACADRRGADRLSRRRDGRRDRHPAGDRR
ncbi:MAG: saccharopine dehydrogenase NADP-binding domain-containing protein, partial [Dermatophilaceae bacterium]